MPRTATTRSSLAVPVYRGSFGRREAERLLWRAGFGPKRGQAERLAKLGLRKAVASLRLSAARTAHRARPPRRRRQCRSRRGTPGATTISGGSTAWCGRRRPLVERMTLVWHDWFATSNDGVGSQKLMLRQNALFRKRALGSFSDLLVDVTRDPAMLLWLSGTDNSRWEPNENYARELMELFTLGASRGYTERDVRQQARALTGFRNDWNDSGPSELPLRQRRGTTPGSRGSSGSGAGSTGRTPAGSASITAGTRRSSSRSCGATSFRSPRVRPQGRPSSASM